MKSVRKLLTVTAAACIGAALGGVLVRGAAREPRPPGEVGRYAAAGVDANAIYLVDSTTGECWKALIHGEDPQWQRFVPPLDLHPPRAKTEKL